MIEVHHMNIQTFRRKVLHRHMVSATNDAVVLIHSTIELVKLGLTILVFGVSSVRCWSGSSSDTCAWVEIGVETGEEGIVWTGESERVVRVVEGIGSPDRITFCFPNEWK